MWFNNLDPHSIDSSFQTFDMIFRIIKENSFFNFCSHTLVSFGCFTTTRLNFRSRVNIFVFNSLFYLQQNITYSEILLLFVSVMSSEPFYEIRER